MIEVNPDLSFSGDRFTVHYSLHGYDEADVNRLAEFIRAEQTVEFPVELIPPGEMRDQMVGRIESVDIGSDSTARLAISYAVESSGYELVQLLNVVYGNISFLEGIRVERLELPDVLTGAFKGPRFGRAGIRSLLGVPPRPLVSTALKPMGLSPEQVADMAYRCARGGIDIIKDDHGFSNQAFCPFDERVPRCIDAIARANQETGYRTLYFPNISGRAEDFRRKVEFARDAGADGLLLMPAFVGPDVFRMVAEDDDIALPVMLHPGLWGTYRSTEVNGFSPYVIHGQLSRLMGADITIFPHYGGRFSPPPELCRAALDGTSCALGDLRPNLPSPGGGVKPESFADMAAFYGVESVFLIAGNLHRHGDDLSKTAAYLRGEVEKLIDA